MALAAATVWEVRTTGSDANGGGFVAGASGTDFSQQSAAQYTFADLASTTGTSASPAVTSASHTFVAADVGNIMQITAGTSWTAGFYQIVSVAAGAATLDKACGSVASLSSGTYAVGGALATPGKAGSVAVGGNWCYLRSGTYNITSAASNVAGGCVSWPSGTATNQGRVIGYQTTRGDLGTKPLLLAGAISTFTLLTVGPGNYVENVAVDGATKTSSRGIVAATARAYACKASNCTNSGFVNGEFHNCEATGCSTSAAFAATAQTQVFYCGCVAHDNTSPGFSQATGSGVHLYSISYNNTIGFQDAGTGARMFNCTAYGNSSHGFSLTVNGANTYQTTLYNCLSYGNTGAGVSSTSSVANTALNLAVGSNTGGAVTGGIVVVNQINLTTDPFTNAAGLDFSLNNTAGGGAAVRAAGIPGPFPAVSTTGYVDIGAVQHQDVGGTVTNIFILDD